MVGGDGLSLGRIALEMMMAIEKRRDRNGSEGLPELEGSQIQRNPAEPEWELAQEGFKEDGRVDGGGSHEGSALGGVAAVRIVPLRMKAVPSQRCQEICSPRKA